MHNPALQPRATIRAVLAAFLALLALAPAAAAQQVFHACYVPDVGAVYMIKAEGLPPACLSGTHVEVSWTDGGALADGSVTTALLADGTVTAPKLADAAVTPSKLASGAVAEGHLSFDPATQAELQAFAADLASTGTLNDAANPVEWSQLKSVPAGFADGVDDSGGPATSLDCGGCVTGAEVADHSLDSLDLAASSVGASELAPGSVGSSHLGDEAVTVAKIAPDVPLPVAMGVFYGVGGCSAGSGTANLTACTYDSTFQRYVITITGHSYVSGLYVTVVTPISIKAYASTGNDGSGNLLVYLYDDAGTLVQGNFQIVVYKP